ncbi:hypothetical protein Trydic_g13593 [Trypoxylus dichotomus]
MERGRRGGDGKRRKIRCTVAGLKLKLRGIYRHPHQHQQAAWWEGGSRDRRHPRVICQHISLPIMIHMMFAPLMQTISNSIRAALYEKALLLTNRHYTADRCTITVGYMDTVGPFTLPCSRVAGPTQCIANPFIRRGRISFE